MKKLLLSLIVIGLLTGPLNAQCPAGYSNAALNWDNLTYLTTSGSFSGYVTAAMAETQKFSIGKNKVTVTYSNGLTPAGDVLLHTGEANAYGIGADLEYNGDGTVTISFATEVANVKFSVFDIDGKQTAVFTATNAGNVAVPIVVTKLNTSSTDISITGSATTTVSVTDTKTSGQGTGAGNNVNTSSVNVDVAGLVKTINIALSTSSNTKDFFISDFSACISETAYPSNYRIISQPYTNQPGYLLAARNATIYMVDPATGKAKFIFTDPSNKNINSMGYDPYNKILYYTYSLTGGAAANKEIMKYDFNTETISTLISDVTTLGIPVFSSGVESGGASFYDGAFYVGIEGGTSARSIVWRIDFDTSLNAVSATQAFGIATAGHDWGDFAVSNGILYDFDGSASGNENVYHLDLQTGAFASTYGTLPFAIRQVAEGWNEQIYNIGGAPSSTGEVAPYNYNGTVNAAQQQVITVGTTIPAGSWGDAAGGFKPKADFGDAPSTYDPIGFDPAIHEFDTSLRLGSAIDMEWDKRGATSLADADADDGMPFVPIFCPCTYTYTTTVNVWNNTGADATLIGWLDFNGNNVFDAEEAISATVSSMASMQEITLHWANAPTPIPPLSYTYFRLRLTSASNGMTSANPYGYFSNGEVEDYRILVDGTPLPLQLLSFNAQKKNENEVAVNWKITSDQLNTEYELQRSSNGVNWQTIDHQISTSVTLKSIYSFTDVNPEVPFSYYRLKLIQNTGAYSFSETKKVEFKEKRLVDVHPNPSSGRAVLKIYTATKESVEVSIVDIGGRKLSTEIFNLQKGNNSIVLSPVQKLKSGVYFIQIKSGLNIYTEKLIIEK